MASAGAYDIAKAGWLYRQTSVLHRWKKQWFVLDRHGDLRYFESPDDPRAEDRLVLRAVVTHVRVGAQCRKADIPEGLNRATASFIELLMRDKESMLLCAESPDDMKAWQIALDEARSLNTPTGPPPYPTQRYNTTTTTYVSAPGYVQYGTPYAGYGYGGYPGHVISPPSAQVVHTPQGTTTIVQAPAQQVVYIDDCPRRRYHRRGFYGPVFFW